jgi:hypothetical protein
MELCKKKATDLSKLWIHVALILLAGIVFCGWGLSRTNFFQFDDYTWQWSTLNTSFADLFNVIPNAPYNDRPVGAVLIKGLFSLFGMNEVAQHAVLLLILEPTKMTWSGFGRLRNFWVMNILLRGIPETLIPRPRTRRQQMPLIGLRNSSIRSILIESSDHFPPPPIFYLFKFACPAIASHLSSPYLPTFLP